MVNTLNRGEIMKKRIVMYSIYGICLLLMIGLLVAYNVTSTTNNSPAILTDYDYAIDIFKNTLAPVVSQTEEVTISRPYTAEGVKIVRNYYDYRDDEKEQQKAIIYYDGTYMQSTGIYYAADKEFDVLAVLSGEVTEVLTDELVGNSITIKHDDNTYSIYQSLKDITVKKGDRVNQGDKLATTGTSNINKDLNNHLYFELMIGGLSVNPEEYYDAAL